MTAAVELMDLKRAKLDAQQEARDQETKLQTEFASLAALDDRLYQALQLNPNDSETLRTVVGRMASALNDELRKGNEDVDAKRREIRNAHQQKVNKHCHTAVEELLGQHLLPNVKHDLEWSFGNDRATGAMTFELPKGLKADFAIDIPIDSPWSVPVRVGSLAAATIPELSSRPWSKPRWRPRKLRNCYIARVSWRDSLREIDILHRIHRPSNGYRLRFSEGDRITLRHLNESGEASAEPMWLAGSATVSLNHLWKAITDALTPLTTSPRRLLRSHLNGEELGAAPDAVATVILQALAPAIRTAIDDGADLFSRDLRRRIQSLSREQQGPFRQLHRGRPRVTKTPPKPPVRATPPSGLGHPHVPPISSPPQLAIVPADASQPSRSRLPPPRRRFR